MYLEMLRLRRPADEFRVLCGQRLGEAEISDEDEPFATDEVRPS